MVPPRFTFIRQEKVFRTATGTSLRRTRGGMPRSAAVSGRSKATGRGGVLHRAFATQGEYAARLGRKLAEGPIRRRICRGVRRCLPDSRYRAAGAGAVIHRNPHGSAAQTERAEPFGRLRPFPYCPRLSDAFRATVRNPRERGHVERPGILRTLPPSGPFFLRKAGAAVSDGIADVRPFLAAVPFLSCPQHGVSALSQLEKPRCGTPASYMCAARLSAYPRRHRPHPRKCMSSGSGTPPEQSHPAGCKSQNRPFKGRFDLTL